jgi:hypothetical protein
MAGEEIGKDAFKDMTLEQVLADVSNRVYEATRFFEDLEHSGQIWGNGHHLRQQLAEKAQALVLNRWENRDEKLETSQLSQNLFLHEDQSVIFPEGIKPPLSDAQVEFLNHLQEDGPFFRQECIYGSESHAEGPSPILRATRDRWVCSDSTCSFTQEY